jgi:sulfoxide reductase heme-binding subunit YedZ
MSYRNTIAADASAASVSPLLRRWVDVLLKPGVFLVSLLPLVQWVWALVNNQLGANPIEALSHGTGEWALRFLLIGLLATPLQTVFRWRWPARLRRMLGLYAFFYAVLHVLVYVWLDQQWHWRDILSDIVGKPYLLAGLSSVLILLPLAVTSNRYMIRALGKAWKALHRWVYIAALAACLHWVWLAKGDQLLPVVYLGLLMGLLLWRFMRLLSPPNRRRRPHNAGMM